MGMSASSTQLIFFIAALVVASAVVGTVAKGVMDITNGIDEKGDLIDKQLKTDITIINDPENVPNNPVKIYVKNIGSVTLNQSMVSIILNGTAETSFTTSVSGGTGSYWSPSSTLTITISTTLPSGDYTVIITTENGVKDSLDFTI
ncbi:MAG TPA: flagellar protein G [Euryarchaeota archaeon]|nr:flagellar protein G [Euryarchaeota archaeon]